MDVVAGGFGFIEGDLNDAQTSNTSTAKREPKVAVGHALGFDDVPWAGSWQELRAGLGISADACR